MKNAARSCSFVRKVLLLSAVLLLFSLAGCGKYTSSYRAVGFAHSNESSRAFMSFHSFDGRMVFRLKSDGEGELNYSAALESGSAFVYCEHNGSRTELFSLRGGDEIASCEHVGNGTVYIVVETNEKCMNGFIRLNLNQPDD